MAKKTKPAAVSSKPDEKREIMDRPTLLSITKELKGAGADLKALKSDTDEQLQKKVSDAIQALPSAEIVKKIESVDPNKLTKTLKLDCFGIFVDLRDVSCVRCPDAGKCAAKFVKNVREGFTVVDGALSDAAKEEPAKAQTKAVKPVDPATYVPGRPVFVRDVKNPNPKDDDYHDVIQRVLDEQPETLAEMRAIVEDEFDLEGDADFMRFVTMMRDPKEGVIKLDVDLVEKDKIALRKAGYEI